MSNDGVWLKVRLPEHIHRQVRLSALDNRQTLAEYVIGRLGGSKVVAPVKVAPVAVSESKKAFECAFCYKQVTEWERINGFVVCLKCKKEKYGN